MPIITVLIILGLIALGYLVPLSTLIGVILYYNANSSYFVSGFVEPVRIPSFANPYFSLTIAFIAVQTIRWIYRKLVEPERMVITVTEI